MLAGTGTVVMLTQLAFDRLCRRAELLLASIKTEAAQPRLMLISYITAK